MDIFCKRLFYKTKQKTIIENPVKILGKMPTDFYVTNYRLMKRGDEFFAIVNNSPQNGTKTTAVQNLNFISKTKDFQNWTGSAIGSGYTMYDEKSDSFFSVTLGEHYEGTVGGIALVAYHITKINPDDFSYSNKTIMPDTKMSETSRMISPIQRIGNYLVMQYHKESTNCYTAYSTDNGNNWTSKKLYSVSSFGVGGCGTSLVSNGTKFLASGYYGSTSQSRRCFTSPTASVASNCGSCKSDKPIHTIGNHFYYYNSSNNQISLTTDFVKYSKTLNVKKNSIGNQCYFYDKYLIASCNGSFNVDSSDDSSHLGMISIFDTTSGQMYVFDTGLNVAYTQKSGSYTYKYGYIQLVGLIDDELYFIFQCISNKTYRLAKVSISHVLENMVVHNFT